MEHDARGTPVFVQPSAPVAGERGRSALAPVMTADLIGPGAAMLRLIFPCSVPLHYVTFFTHATSNMAEQ
ncbi:hypothetical protein RoseRS_2599 [Roseiflexus sp. RS-1]|nr:hypothetical protein RoseRS_2599 [Roseiflexus sp. RS-1]